MAIDCRALLESLTAQGIYLFEKAGRLGFKTAAGATLSDAQKQQIKAMKPQLIAFLAASQTQAPMQALAPPLLPQLSDAAAPLSFAQQQLWSVQSLSPHATEYHMNFVFDVKGDFNLKAAEASFQAIVQRHQVLRSVYVEQNGVVLQQVCAAQPAFKIPLSEIAAAQWHNVLPGRLAEQRQQPFDLQADRMLRCHFYRCGTAGENLGCGVLLLSLHHIAADGWSMDILVREFVANYIQAAQGLAIHPAPLPIQYRDYAKWQRDWFHGEVLDSALEYWDRQLADLPVCHSLATTQPRPATKQSQAGHVSGELDASIATAIEQRCREQGMTPFMLLHGALALVLARHSQCSDIAIGIPSANRTEKAVTDLIGYFVNTLLLRVNTADVDLPAYFAQVKQAHLDAQANQSVPFETLVERSKVVRNAAHNPLFQIMLITNTDYGLAKNQSGLSLPDVSIRLAAPTDEQVKFDMDIQLDFTPAGISLGWAYDLALFSAAQVAAFNQDLMALLSCLASLPSFAATTVADVMRPPGASQALIEQEFIEQPAIEQATSPLSTALDSKQLFSAFDRKVAQSGDDEAVCVDQATLSFAAVDSQVNQYVRLLLADGYVTGQGTIITAKNKLDWLIQLLALMRCGGYYGGDSDWYGDSDFYGDDYSKGDGYYVMPDPIADTLTLHDRPDYPYHDVQFYRLTENSKLSYAGLYQRGSVISERWSASAKPCWATLNWQQKRPYNVIAMLLQGWCVRDMSSDGLGDGLSDVPGDVPGDEITVLEGDVFDLVRYARNREQANLPNIFVPKTANLCTSSLRQLSNKLRPEASVVVGLLASSGHCFATYSSADFAPQSQSQPQPQSFTVVAGWYGQLLDDSNEFCPAMSSGHLILRPHASKNTLIDSTLVVRQTAASQFECVEDIAHLDPQRAQVIEMAYAMADVRLCHLVEVRSSAQVDLYLEVSETALLSCEALCAALAKQLSDSPLGDFVRQVTVVWHCADLNAPPRATVQLGVQAKSAAQLALEAQLIAVWATLLPNKADELSAQANIFDLGATSMLLILALAKINNELGLTLEPAVILQNPNIEMLARHLSDEQHEQSKEPASSMIVPLASESSLAQATGPTVYWIHPFGGSVQGYQALAAQLPLNSFGVQAPFYASVEAAYTSWEMLLDDYANQIAQHWDQQNDQQGDQQDDQQTVILAGFSLGGVIAGLLTQKLQLRGIKVCGLWLLDSYAQAFSAIHTPDMLTRLRYILSFVNVDPAWVDSCADGTATLSSVIPALAERLAEQKGIEATFAAGYLHFHQLLGTFDDGALAMQMDLSELPVCLVSNQAATLWAQNQQDWVRLCGDQLQSHSIPFSHDDFLTEKALEVIQPLLLQQLKQIGM